MGMIGTIGVGAAGGAVAGMALGLGVLNSRPPELFGLAGMTAVTGAAAGLGAGVAGRFTSPLRAALIGSAIAGLIPTGFATASRRATGDEQAFLGIAAIFSGVGIAGGAAALVGRALMRR